MCFVIFWFSVNYLFVFSSTRNASFLYGDRPVSLRVSLRLFLIFYIPFLSPCLFLPVLSKSLPFHLKYLLLPLSFLSFFVFSLSRIHMRAYILQCASFFLLFPFLSFLCFTTPLQISVLQKSFLFILK